MITRRIALIAVAALLPACTPARNQPAPSPDLARIQDRLDASEEKVAQLSRKLAMLQVMVDRHERTLQQTPADGDTSAGPAPSSETPVLPVPDELPSAGTPPPAPVTSPETAPAPERQPGPEGGRTEETMPVSGSAANLSYDRAMDTFKAGGYDAAADQFITYAETFPSDALADNALYWAGECRYTKKRFQEAISLFKRVVEDYPSGSKVPDALLKIGYAYISLGDTASAGSYLKQVIARYPFSTAGSKAEERLKKLQ